MKAILSSGRWWLLLLHYYYCYCCTVATEAFEWSVGGRPEVTRQAIAGLWRLIPLPPQPPPITYPLKEFTVYPKESQDAVRQQRRQQQTASAAATAAGQESLLLMLKEDGSFQRYMSEMEEDADEDEEQQQQVDVNSAWNQYQQQQQLQQDKQQRADQDDVYDDNNDDETTRTITNQLMKGVWDYRDGKLILAADRPDDQDDLRRRDNNGRSSSNKAPRSSSNNNSNNLDKLIVGRVVATYESSLQDNPVLACSSSSSSSATEKDNTETKEQSVQSSSNNNTTTSNNNSNNSNYIINNNNPASVDGHLSVPKGSLKVGKFFYPKKHPSFFEQPIYNPVNTHRRFQLQQVLGTWNTATTPLLPDSKDNNNGSGSRQPPQFRPVDFYNKTFLLSSHPLSQRQQRIPAPPSSSSPFGDEQREQPWMPKKRKHGGGSSEEETINPLAESAHIRVMQVRFFPNNTFATVWGTGDAILRGKFDTFLRSNDDNYAEKNTDGTTQLWMQVIRFGFGRGVSGSVYSEGRTLSHEDAKTYWGTISRVNITTTTTTTTTSTSITGSNQKNGTIEESVSSSILEVEGSVLFGTGIGAEPVGRFLMREMIQEEILFLGEDDDDEEEDDDDDEDDDEEELDLSSTATFSTSTIKDDGLFDDPILAEVDDPTAFQ